ncbi:MAG: protein kinase [Kofleriaceae bacterium]
MLAELAEQPIAQWRHLLARAFPDQPALVQQCLLWLHAGRQASQDEAAPPSLGSAGDERYELTLRLAAGATATVWRAHDRKLGRTVAVKVFGAPAGASHELQEARAASDVISDHVVRVLDVHEGPGRPYIVMELVAEHDEQRGELALGAAASSCRPRGVDEAVRWLLDVTRGVRDAHLRNVFHRDLKPQNVLITPISRRARIADFGLALSAGHDPDGFGSFGIVARRTAAVSIAGTPEYLSPEQARGLPIQLDPLRFEHRSMLVAIDVWGLGALAYDLLGGRPPWRAATNDAEEPWEVAASGATPPPLVRALHGPRIPSSLRRVVGKAMALEPHDRYTSAGQLARELEAVLARRPTSLDRSPASRAALWCQRNPQLTITGVVALALAMMTLVTYASVQRLRDQRRTLTTEMRQQQVEADEIKHRAGALRGELERTKRQLQTEGQALAGLERDLRDDQKTYAALIAAKDQALHDASAATRGLIEQLTSARAERRTGESELTLYRQFWDTARADRDRVTRERDQLQRERDTARTERDAANREREAVSAERDRARSERDQVTRDLARLSADLVAAHAQLATAARHARGTDADVPRPEDRIQPAIDGGAGSDAATPRVKLAPDASMMASPAQPGDDAGAATPPSDARAAPPDASR